MAAPFEVIEIDEIVAACNGGGGPLGHPRVYLNLAPTGHHECPYCSRLYVNRALAHANSDTGASDVVLPSAHQAGAERPSERPAPRQPGSP